MKLSGRSLFRYRLRAGARIATLVPLAVFLAGAPGAMGGKKQDAAMDFSGAAATASPTPQRPKFDVPIPVGHDATGVNLPYFDIHGKLQMYVSIEQATRTDNDHLQMKNANMQTFDEKETPDATIFMTSSVLDLNTRIVTSEVPSIVSRSDFQIVGQKMVFDTQKHKGRMTGHVRMTVYNREAASSPSPSPGATPQSTSTPP